MENTAKLNVNKDDCANIKCISQNYIIAFICMAHEGRFQKSQGCKKDNPCGKKCLINGIKGGCCISEKKSGC